MLPLPTSTTALPALAIHSLVIHQQTRSAVLSIGSHFATVELAQQDLTDPNVVVGGVGAMPHFTLCCCQVEIDILYSDSGFKKWMAWTKEKLVTLAWISFYAHNIFYSALFLKRLQIF